MALKTMTLRDRAFVYEQTISMKTQKTVSWAEFERKYLSREDGYKYEWDNGLIIKTKNIMRPLQRNIVRCIMRFFLTLQIKNPEIGWLSEEADVFLTTGKHKKPDISFFSNDEIDEVPETKTILPRFVIEIISETDRASDVQNKVRHYLEGGVEIVWHIYPNLEEVVIYRKGEDIASVNRGKSLCSAEPVIEGFVMVTEDIFKK
jgi:Uma2 family endonuclease